MVKMRKRIAAIAAAAVMGVSMVSGTCMSANAASSSDSWSVYYAYGAPGNVNPVAYCTIYSYGGGYKSNCKSISGSNDRKVNVTASGINYNITSTGYSAVHKHSSSYSKNTITFKFLASGSRTCSANGTIVQA